MDQETRPERDADRHGKSEEQSKLDARAKRDRQQDDDRDRKPASGKAKPTSDQAGDDDADDKADKDQQKPSPEDERRRRRGRVRTFIIAGIVLAILVTAGVLYWLNARHFESTDDAQIDGHVTQMAAQISGRVLSIAVSDNQHVDAGQLLVTIDPRDYQVRLDQSVAQEANAQASVAQAEAQAGVQRANLEQSRANIRVSEAELIQAEQDYNRQRNVDPRATTRQQVDSATASFRSSQARLEANRRGVDAAQAQVTAADAQLRAARATLQQSHASTDNARLQLSYATLTAPAAGRISRRTVEVGNYVNPGQSLFAIVQDEMWVTANFKETQLTDMRPGQPVRVIVDSFPSFKFNARIDSIQRGTGAVFSTLPAENATGNYVKVVQRVPTKIVFDDERVKDMPLAPGMSVTPRVTVR